ncbi:MAG TPA: KpsF/GutQ family sugar-phosphate isomerase [Bacteroidales bacterium]|nr:KpsF/GutQ family sugar-phosphate isomerase [Bacteroidales bacterium]HSA42831.1 KpsF/GutQ family sugar-phosphate isomerase [Bacteroidales bacterium]
MKTTDEIIQIAKETIAAEADAVSRLGSGLGDDFVSTVMAILQSKGKVVVTGIGKSANIAVKIVATLNSTGTQAVFMHAADAIHGDLGTIRQEDIILCLSKSGNTPEIKVLVPWLKSLGNKLVGMVGNTQSFLARHADYVLDTTVEREACPNNLAPTSSATAQLVMGDALAVALLECRGFTTRDFARFHPGGSLGKQLYLKVEDLYRNNAVPSVQVDESIRNTIIEISSKRLGCTAVLDGEKLTGIITDGDLRRMLQHNQDIDTGCARDIMTATPRLVEPDTLVIDALQSMRINNITQLLVAEAGHYLGVIHLHDILREGIL